MSDACQQARGMIGACTRILCGVGSGDVGGGLTGQSTSGEVGDVGCDDIPDLSAQFRARTSAASNPAKAQINMISHTNK